MPDEKPKKKVKIKTGKPVVTAYGRYSGAQGKEGKLTEDEWLHNNLEYMKTNTPSSNVYHPHNQHISMAYKKRNQDKA